MPRPCPITEEERTRLLDEYRNGKSATLLAKEFGASKKFVLYTLHAAGLARTYREAKDLVPRLAVNHAAFAQAEHSEEAAYWVGFLMADGCVFRRGGSAFVILQISECDRAHIERFRMFLAAESRIATVPADARFNAQAMCRLSIVSKQMADDLGRYGVVPRKAKTARVALLESNPHFWRGMIDGDGCLRFQRKKNYNKGGHYDRRVPILSVSGGKPLMEQFEAFSHSSTSAKAAVHQSHGNWGFTLTSGPCIQMVKLLYGDCHVALDRKLSAASEILGHP